MEKSRGLYGIFLRRLDNLKEGCKKEIIPFPVVFQKLCRNFSISKKECWEVLFFLRDLGVLNIVAYKGIKVN